MKPTAEQRLGQYVKPQPNGCWIYTGPSSLCAKPVDLALSGTEDRMKPSVDHVIPRSKGGTNDLANLSLTHLACNVAKGNRVMNEQLRTTPLNSSVQDGNASSPPPHDVSRSTTAKNTPRAMPEKIPPPSGRRGEGGAAKPPGGTPCRSPPTTAAATTSERGT